MGWPGLGAFGRQHPSSHMHGSLEVAGGQASPSGNLLQPSGHGMSSQGCKRDTGDLKATGLGGSWSLGTGASRALTWGSRRLTVHGDAQEAL